MPVMHAQNTVNGMLQEFSVRFASQAMLLPVLSLKCRGSTACLALLCSIHACHQSSKRNSALHHGLELSTFLCHAGAADEVHSAVPGSCAGGH